MRGFRSILVGLSLSVAVHLYIAPLHANAEETSIEELMDSRDWRNLVPPGRSFRDAMRVLFEYQKEGTFLSFVSSHEGLLECRLRGEIYKLNFFDVRPELIELHNQLANLIRKGQLKEAVKFLKSVEEKIRAERFRKNDSYASVDLFGLELEIKSEVVPDRFDDPTQYLWSNPNLFYLEGAFVDTPLSRFREHLLSGIDEFFGRGAGLHSALGDAVVHYDALKDHPIGEKPLPFRAVIPNGEILISNGNQEFRANNVVSKSDLYQIRKLLLLTAWEEIFHYRDVVHWMQTGQSISPEMNILLQKYKISYEEGSIHDSYRPISYLTEVTVLIEALKAGLLDPVREPEIFFAYLQNHPIRQVAWPEIQEMRHNVKKNSVCESDLVPVTANPVD